MEFKNFTIESYKISNTDELIAMVSKGEVVKVAEHKEPVVKKEIVRSKVAECLREASQSLRDSDFTKIAYSDIYNYVKEFGE